MLGVSYSLGQIYDRPDADRPGKAIGHYDTPVINSGPSARSRDARVIHIPSLPATYARILTAVREGKTRGRYKLVRRTPRFTYSAVFNTVAGLFGLSRSSESSRGRLARPSPATAPASDVRRQFGQLIFSNTRLYVTTSEDTYLR